MGCILTDLGGLAIQYINRTGGTSVKGTVVACSANYDHAVGIAAADALDPIGVILDDYCEEGEPVYVVVRGRAACLLEDGTSMTRKQFVRTSTTAAGRVVCQSIPSPPNSDTHFSECGHACENVNAGTNVLGVVDLHFL